MIGSSPCSAKTNRTRIHLPGAALALALFTAGCASAPGSMYIAWVPGTYEFQATHPGAGTVHGAIEVVDDGPLGVSTDVLGACIPTRALVPGAGGRYFRCAGDYTVLVRRGRRGQDPVVGSVSNQRAEIQMKQVRSGCAEYQESPGGRDVCVRWDYRTVQERVTTGTGVPFRIVPTSGSGPSDPQDFPAASSGT
jgi:hypothetical protein